jgi:hypothetical protein
MGSHDAPSRIDSLQPVSGGKQDTCIGAPKLAVCTHVSTSNVTHSNDKNGVNAKVQQHTAKLCGKAT